MTVFLVSNFTQFCLDSTVGHQLRMEQYSSQRLMHALPIYQRVKGSICILFIFSKCFNNQKICILK